MNDKLFFDCGPADSLGRRLVVGKCGDLEYRDRFNTDDAFRRSQFARAMLAKFDLSPTLVVLVEIEEKLVRLADREDQIDSQQNAARLDTVRVADVPATEVDWLWPGRIAIGKVTLLAGDPGLGKSYVTLDLAARVSRGAPWPAVGRNQSDTEHDRPTTASVILLSAEDDVADTIRPRLEAHNADCERIHVVRAVAGASEDVRYRRSFDLSRDLEHLEALLNRLPDCRLIVIDPVSAYLGRGAENANAEVRGILGPLAILASERKLAVVAVSHLRKEEGAAMYRTMGSMAFIAAARAAWVVCKDRDNPRRRLLLPVKNNLACDTSGLAYTIEPHGTAGRPAVCWSAETVEIPADEAMERPSRPVGRPSDERTEVARWLAEFLAAGPQPASEVREAAEAHGFAYGTLRKAFRELRGVATRIPNTKAWEWQLGPPLEAGTVPLTDLAVPNAQVPV